MPHPFPDVPATAAATALATPSAPDDAPSPGLREMVLAALVAVGGQAYLMRQAEANPRAFLALITKLLTAELRPPRAARPGRTASATQGVAPGTAQPGTVPSAEANPRAFLALLGKVLATELRPSHEPRHGDTGTTEPAGESAGVARPADPPDSLFVMLDDEPLASDLLDTHAPADSEASAPASLTAPRKPQTALHRSIPATMPAPHVSRDGNVATVPPSAPARASRLRIPCATMADLSHQRLGKHAARWRPTFSERWNRLPGNAAGRGAGRWDCARPVRSEEITNCTISITT